MAINDYTIIAEIKAIAPNDTWGTAYDALLTALAKRASRAIDRYTGRKPGAYFVDADVTLYYDGSGCAELWIDELAAAPTSVAVAESGDIKTPTYTTWAATEYVPWPYNAADEGRPYQRLDTDTINGTKAIWYRFRKAVKIVGKFGYALAVPDDVKMVTAIQAMRWFKRGQQDWQDTAVVTDPAQMVYLKDLDPDLALMIEHLRRQAV